MTRLRAIDTALPQQPLIVGMVRDALTGQAPLDRPLVELLWATSTHEPEQAYPLRARVSPSGQFVFGGDPQTSFPEAAVSQGLTLRIRVRAQRYASQTVDVVMLASVFQRIPRSLVVNDFPLTVEIFQAPLVEQNIDLWPNPVHVNGRVVDVQNPSSPVAGAEVRVIAPAVHGPVMTDGDGFFALRTLPVALDVTIEIRHSQYKPLQEVIGLRYESSVNQARFALQPL